MIEIEEKESAFLKAEDLSHKLIESSNIRNELQDSICLLEESNMKVFFYNL